MKRCLLSFVFAILFCAPLAPSAVVAWNAQGHMIVTLIAYDQMNETTRDKAVELIRAHPRFEAHFERSIPREVARNEREQGEWFLAHASTWPDIVRDAKGAVDRTDVNRFNRPYWHYINQPVFLNEAERRTLEPKLRVFTNREPPEGYDDESMNIIQAFKNSTRVLKDQSVPIETRAVHLCWLLHLGGDSHQPLHAASLYTASRFPRGDRGGNDLEIEHGWTLHSFWDDQISTDKPYPSTRRFATAMSQDAKLVAIGKQAASVLDIEKWIDEGYELALRFVYTDEVLQKVAAREGRPHLGPLNLPEEYRANAENVAERRALQAGFRLAKLLEDLLN